jgi:tetratricopeptide (TPR) repeat protein
VVPGRHDICLRLKLGGDRLHIAVRDASRSAFRAEVPGSRLDEGYKVRVPRVRLAGAMAEMGDPAPRPGSWAFVGRDREVAELVAGLEDAIGGRGRLFLIAGEPGIGKTWLAEHLAGHATKRGTRVLWGRCWEGGGAPPFWPWSQTIGDLAEGLDEQTLAAWLGTGAALVARLVPGLGERLGTNGIASVSSPASDAARFSLFEAVTGLFKQAALVQPLLLVLDDLHAADDPSMLLLEFLARDLRGVRLLVLGTYRDVAVDRPEGIGDAIGPLVREGQLVNLGGLDRNAVKNLIEALSGVEPSEAKVAAVHEATEGNPLFVREAVRLLASDATLEDPGRLRVPIPESVRAVIGRRLAPLSADAVLVLSAATVVGREFDLSLVEPACELPVERVLGGLSEAVALGVVAEEDGAVGVYRFSHSLIREVLYERLPIPVRMQLHRRVGEAIERQLGSGLGSRVAELAHHFAEVAAAGEAAKALAYARRAGERAMDMHAYEEAAAQYRRALHALKFAGPDETVRCKLLLRLGAAQARAGRYRDAEESCLEAAELSRRLGLSEQLANAALVLGMREVRGGVVNRQLLELMREALDALPATDSPLRARLLARLSLELTFSEETELVEPISREAVELARRLGDPASLGGALRARWMAVWGPDGLEERSALAEETLRLARATDDQELELAGRIRRVTSSLESGDIRVVEADISACARLADELRMPSHQWTVTTMRAMWALLQGSLDEAETLAEQARSLQPDGPNAFFAYNDLIEMLRWFQGRPHELRQAWRDQVAQFPRFVYARVWVSLTDTEPGEAATTRRLLQFLADELPKRPRDGLWPPAVAVAAVVAARLHNSAAADHLYRALLPYRTYVIVGIMPHPVVCFGSASFYLGLLATVTARWEEAADHFEAAIAANDRLGAGPLLARTRYEYARMLLARGQAADGSRALRLLEEALATASTLGMAALVEGIQRLQAARAGGPSQLGTGAEAVAPEVAGNVFRREGEYWTVAYEGSVVRLKDTKGLRHLARLLAHPGREFHATDLEAAQGQAAQAGPVGPRGRPEGGGLAVRPDLGDAGALLDATAKAAYKTRLDELGAELEEAQGYNDPVRAANARAERDFLVGELARAVGLGGRDRRAAAHAERARLNATRAIRAAIANLTRANPSLGRHLALTIRTGRYCSYTPDPRAPIAWER